MTDKEKKTLERLKKKEAEEKKEAAKRSRIFKDMCKEKFGLTPTELGNMLSKNGDENDDEKWLKFGKDVATKYGLKDQDDVDKWMRVVPNPKGLQFWEENRNTNRTTIVPHTEA